MKEEDNKNQLPASPHPALQRLGIFVGRWEIQGVLSAGPYISPLELSGESTYEWMSGKFFLMHRNRMRVGEETSERVELLGYDRGRKRFYIHFFDSKGKKGVMCAGWLKELWVIFCSHARFSGSFNKEGDRLAGSWEQSFDGVHWLHVMDIQLSRL